MLLFQCSSCSMWVKHKFLAMFCWWVMGLFDYVWLGWVRFRLIWFQLVKRRYISLGPAGWNQLDIPSFLVRLRLYSELMFNDNSLWIKSCRYLTTMCKRAQSYRTCRYRLVTVKHSKVCLCNFFDNIPIASDRYVGTSHS